MKGRKANRKAGRKAGRQESRQSVWKKKLMKIKKKKKLMKKKKKDIEGMRRNKGKTIRKREPTTAGEKSLQRK